MENFQNIYNFLSTIYKKHYKKLLGTHFIIDAKNVDSADIKNKEQDFFVAIFDDDRKWKGHCQLHPSASIKEWIENKNKDRALISRTEPELD